MEHKVPLAFIVCLLVTMSSQAASHRRVARDSDNMVFPTDDNSSDRRGAELLLARRSNIQASNDPYANCSDNSYAWYAPTHQCEELLSVGPCNSSRNEWLVLRNSVPRCVVRECPDKQVMYQRSCQVIRDTPPCPPGMEIVIMENGQGECDCRPGYVYWNRNNRGQGECHELYRKGPCTRGQVLYLPEDVNTKARCRINRCKDGEVDVIIQEGKILLTWLGRFRGTCYPLNTVGEPCQDNKMLGVNTTTMALDCVQNMNVANRNMINAPLLNCSPGSRRDSLGRCRRSMA